MSAPYEEVRKGMERAAAGWDGEAVPDELLPAPTSVTVPIPSWYLPNQGGISSEKPMTLRRETRPRSFGPILVIEQEDQRIEIHPAAIDELYFALRAARRWKPPS